MKHISLSIILLITQATFCPETGSVRNRVAAFQQQQPKSGTLGGKSTPMKVGSDASLHEGMAEAELKALHKAMEVKVPTSSHPTDSKPAPTLIFDGVTKASKTAATGVEEATAVVAEVMQVGTTAVTTAAHTAAATVQSVAGTAVSKVEDVIQSGQDQPQDEQGNTAKSSTGESFEVVGSPTQQDTDESPQEAAEAVVDSDETTSVSGAKSSKMQLRNSIERMSWLNSMMSFTYLNMPIHYDRESKILWCGHNPSYPLGLVNLKEPIEAMSADAPQCIPYKMLPIWMYDKSTIVLGFMLATKQDNIRLEDCIFMSRSLNVSNAVRDAMLSNSKKNPKNSKEIIQKLCIAYTDQESSQVRYIDMPLQTYQQGRTTYPLFCGNQSLIYGEKFTAYMNEHRASGRPDAAQKQQARETVWNNLLNNLKTAGRPVLNITSLLSTVMPEEHPMKSAANALSS